MRGYCDKMTMQKILALVVMIMSFQRCNCRAAPDSMDHKMQNVQIPDGCVDMPEFANCTLIVEADYCTNKYYTEWCCRSCTIAGQLRENIALGTSYDYQNDQGDTSEDTDKSENWFISKTDTVTCEEGKPITSEYECKEAAISLGRTFSSSENSSSFPKGCYTSGYSHFINDTSFYFNTNPTGGARTNWNPVCGIVSVVDGGFSDWDDWTKCSATCGEGKQTRTRRCDNPPAQNEGKNCEGELIETQICNEGPCPSWASWDAWTTCTAACGEGQQTRSRRCNNPPAQNAGKGCEGELINTQICNEDPCPVTKEGVPCKVPWKYEKDGPELISCIVTSSSPWCATTVNSDLTYDDWDWC